MPESTQPESTPKSFVPAAAGVFLLAVCLRPAITSVGPVLERIGLEENLGEGAQGVLGAIPLLAFAAISPFVHRLAGRTGMERTVVLSLVVLGLGTLVRSWSGPGQMTLWLGTAVVGAAIAVGNVLGPALVKRDYAGRVSGAMGVYTAFITGAAATASLVAVPLANVSNWRTALAVWAVPSFLAAVLWLPRARAAARPVPVSPGSAETATNVWKWPTAWLVTAYMGLQSTTFYITITWLPSIETEHGVSPEVAGVHLFIASAAGIIGGLLVPFLMRGRSQVLAAVAAAVPVIIWSFGVLFAPSLFLLWAVCSGIGTGAALVVALALISLRGRSQHETTRLSGMAQSLGYLLATAGPIAAGFLTEHTGNWDAAVIMVAGIATVQILVALKAGQPPKASLTKPAVVPG
ncbi:MFS transporter [Kineosporia babensis]|uniref:MFS transporter n=1 Tax=Kineosporia babensis TaxID=499548 RepID=A0A9X1NJD0_9ACTN|nr:MFS transporter [Kineosporia babensis]MCD5314271.1 MFS transporter [Kineosporia babensis]